jgi:hypothetical protein
MAEYKYIPVPAIPAPTFVAKFADGEITRMSVFHPAPLRDYDVVRGVRLSIAAYEIRHSKLVVYEGQRPQVRECTPAPAIVEAAYVDPHSEETLRVYSVEELLAARQTQKPARSRKPKDKEVQ